MGRIDKKLIRRILRETYSPEFIQDVCAFHPELCKDGELIDEKIKKIGDKWVLYPKKGGDRLGTHSSKKGAENQETAINISKAKRG
jgi:hypothetical protein